MVRPVICYITASFDGFIADAEGGVAWLSGAPGEDYGYREFFGEIDTVLLGRSTYEQIVSWGGPFEYAEKDLLVFSSNADLPLAGDKVEIVTTDAERRVARLKIAEGGPIWLGGGGKLFTTLFDAGLVDEIRLFVQPVVLGTGVPLWVGEHDRRALQLVGSKAWPGDLVELHYKVRSRWRADVGGGE